MNFNMKNISDKRCFKASTVIIAFYVEYGLNPVNNDVSNSTHVLHQFISFAIAFAPRYRLLPTQINYHDTIYNVLLN